MEDGEGREAESSGRLAGGSAEFWWQVESRTDQDGSALRIHTSIQTGIQIIKRFKIDMFIIRILTMRQGKRDMLDARYV